MASQRCARRITSEMFYVVAVIFSYFVVVSHSQDCSKRVTERDGSSRCYSLVFAGDTWSVAGRQCESRGPSSRLAVVSSATQNDAIAALLQENGLSESWLAASETVHGWQWINGSEVSYQGCYRHEEQPSDHKVPLSGVNSPQRCVAECTASRYSYAGLQNGDECWCGNSFVGLGQRSATCTIQCPGQDTTAFCGGHDSLDVYAVSGLYSNWKHNQPYNPTGNTNCAVMETTQDEVYWMDYACSHSHFGALCDRGPATADECNGTSPSSFVVGDRCVDVISDVMTYFEARAVCRKRDPTADLVQLMTETDNAQAAAALRTYLNSTADPAPNAFWIGLMRSHWSWKSGPGSVMTFTNWDTNTPTATTAADQQCAILSRSIGGRWKNVPCSLTKPFVCEDVNTVPKTTTTTTRTTTTTTTTTTPTRKSSGGSIVSLSTRPPSSSTASSQAFVQSSPASASNLPFSTGVLIGIVCGGFVFLLIVVIVVVIICTVYCRRKHGVCCCCGRQSDAEATTSNNDDAAEADLKPYYYFGVTADDLHRAGETSTGNGGDVTYASVTTPPPDVVPHMELSADASSAAAPAATQPAMTTFAAVHRQPADTIYADSSLSVTPKSAI